VKHGAQCATNFFTKNADGSYTCETFGEKKEVHWMWWVFVVLIWCCVECCQEACAETCCAHDKKKSDQVRASRPSHLVRAASSSLIRIATPVDDATWGVTRVQPTEDAGDGRVPVVEEGVEIVPSADAAADLPVGIPVVEPLPGTVTLA